MSPRPVVHGRDHEHGGADVIRILWTDEPPDGGIGDGVNDADIHVTWTYLGGIFGLDTVIADTLENGTTPGFWNETDGTTMFCQLTGTWQIDIEGTVTHSSTTAPTIVRLHRAGGTSDDMFSENMANGDSSPLTYTMSGYFAVDDFIKIAVTHAVGIGTPSSTLTGTVTFTLIP